MKFKIEQIGTQVDFSNLFEELEKVVKDDEEKGIIVTRKHPAKKILNRFSGRYISPTIIQGFESCPCKQIVQSVTERPSSSVLSIGVSVHAIFERFYNLKPLERTKDNIDKITQEVILENSQSDSSNTILSYIENFWNMDDYLTGKEVDHSNIECYNEVFTKGEISPLGVKLPLPVYCLADRLDFRDEGVFILDYKTGTYMSKKSLGMEGYLPQLICYKWGIEEEYGVDVNGAYLITPGISDKKSHKLNVSLENESRYIERIFKYCEDIAPVTSDRVYKQKRIKYCSSCPFSKECNLFNGSKEKRVIWMDYKLDYSENDKEIKDNNLDQK